ncbi:putative membrane protein [Campylobacter blaseri]|uniref:Uncharacterized protein n=1 Tax=Campylobacter blaseri TaxID=2042961 RepID=A0A2P8R0G9_9BACT|nr:hypothetical protein [Campylobacter blaseri]PSM51994.1 hypothetical protein CQ405_05370 [Campylobacter blaseri]PSM53779.1 hypothetical protein CRN67_05370 [Campylobacter blaseri]QKF85667.1 putative membrane protein [Campylobacter blaseri]
MNKLTDKQIELLDNEQAKTEKSKINIVFQIILLSFNMANSFVFVCFAFYISYYVLFVKFDNTLYSPVDGMVAMVEFTILYLYIFLFFLITSIILAKFFKNLKNLNDFFKFFCVYSFIIPWIMAPIVIYINKISNSYIFTICLSIVPQIYLIWIIFFILKFKLESKK